MINIEKKITERFKFGLNLYAAVNNVKSILEQTGLKLELSLVEHKKKELIREKNYILSF